MVKYSGRDQGNNGDSSSRVPTLRSPVSSGEFSDTRRVEDTQSVSLSSLVNLPRRESFMDSSEVGYMISVEEAMASIRESVQTKSPERLPFTDVLGCVLDEDVCKVQSGSGVSSKRERCSS